MKEYFKFITQLVIELFKIILEFLRDMIILYGIVLFFFLLKEMFA
jgi:hypothetical protein